MKYTRTNQGGSVVSFVVIGVVLVALVAGGIYLLQRRGGDKSESPVATTSQAPAPSQSTKPNNSTVPTPQASAQSSQPPATNQKAAPGASPSPSPSSSASAPTGGSGSSATMPVTGPSDMLPSGFAAAILLAVSVAFVQSLRARRHLFDQ